MPQIFQHYLDIFDEYVSPYLEMEAIASSMRIKKEHSLNVVQLGKEIAQDVHEKNFFAIGIACLFHDIGRFEQMRIYNTFHDPKSCNHALLGLKVFKEKHFLDTLDLSTKKRVYTAIALHNRLHFPMNIPHEYLPICLVLRDADKIDIMRVMVENFINRSDDADTVFLHVKDKPYVSPHVIQSLLLAKSIRYSDLRYVNDFKLLLGGWLNDIHYKSARRIIQSRGYLDLILEDLPNTAEVNEAVEYIHKLMK